MIAELPFWRELLDKPSLALLDGALDAGRDVVGTAGHLQVTLPASVTQALLTQVPARFHGGVQEVLLTGLAVALCDWCRRRGRGGGAAVLVDVEGHGREEVVGPLDLSRTVGWFTSLYPVRLDVAGIELSDALTGGASLGRALKSIKEQLRAVPEKGIGFGLLRYLNAATAGALSGPGAAASFRSTTWAGLRRRGTASGALRTTTYGLMWTPASCRCRMVCRSMR